MAKIALSDVGLRNLEPPSKGQRSYWDKKLPSFGVRVSQGGTKTFVLNKDNSLITIGRFGILTLSKAREEAKRLLAERTLGKVRPQSITFAQAKDLFIQEKERGRKPRTAAEYQRLLSRLPFKGQLSDISHDDFQHRLKKFTSPSERDHVLVASKVFFNWCIKRRYIEHNPTLGLSQNKSTSRTRVLTDPELKAIYEAAGALGDFGEVVHLLIRTGCRRGEIAALRSEYFDAKNLTLCLPETLTKNHHEHLFPVTPDTAAILESKSRLRPNGHLFPARGKTTPLNGWSKYKKLLDQKCGVTDWTLHDLRRTFATNLATLGVQPHVVERLLNHTTGTISGVAAIYNRASYMEEMRAAVQLWEAKLQSIVR